MKERNVVVPIACPFCRKEHSVKVNRADYYNWLRGELAQKAFPYLTATEREQLISRMCPACQAKLFGEEN